MKNSASKVHQLHDEKALEHTYTLVIGMDDREEGKMGILKTEMKLT